MKILFEPPLALEDCILAKLIDLAKAISNGDSQACESVYREISSFMVDQGNPVRARWVANWVIQGLLARMAPNPRPTLSYSSLSHCQKETMEAALKASIVDRHKPYHLVLIQPALFKFFQLDVDCTLEKLTLIRTLKKHIAPQKSRTLKEQTQLAYKVDEMLAKNGAEIVAQVKQIQRTREDEAILVVWVHTLNTLLHQAGLLEQALSTVKLLNPELMLVIESELDHNCANFTKRLAETFTYHLNFLSYEFNTALSPPASMAAQIQLALAADQTLCKHQTLAKWQVLLEAAGFSQIPLSDARLTNPYDSTKYNGALIDCFNVVASAWKPSPASETILPPPVVVNDSSTFTARNWSPQEVRAYLNRPIDATQLIPVFEQWKIRNTDTAMLIGLQNVIRHLDPIAPPSAEAHYVHDVVIEKYLDLLMRRSNEFPNLYIKNYSLPTFISKFLVENQLDLLKAHLRVGREIIEIHEASKVFMPVCVGEHWFLICIDLELKAIFCYNSLRGPYFGDEMERLVRGINDYILPEMGYPNRQWPFHDVVNIPQQQNAVDCGVFLLKYADCLCHGLHFPFDQRDMIHFRNGIVFDICQDKLHSYHPTASQNDLSMDRTMDRCASATEIISVLEKLCCGDWCMAVSWATWGYDDSSMSSNQKRTLQLLETAFHVPKDMHKSALRMFRYWAWHRTEEGQGLAGQALRSSYHCISNFEDLCHPIVALQPESNKYLHGPALGIVLKSKALPQDSYVIEFFLSNGLEMNDVKEILEGLDQASRGWRFVSLLEGSLEECSKQLGDVGLYSKKRKRRAQELKTFDKVELDGQTWAVCKVCNEKCSPWATSSLLQHSSKCFKKCQQQNTQADLVAGVENQPTTDFQFPESPALGEWNHQSDSDFFNWIPLDVTKMSSELVDCRDELARMIIKHGYPVSMAQDKFFKEFVKKLLPLLDISVHSEGIKDRIIELYDIEKEKLKEWLKNISGRFCLTVDLQPYGDKKVVYACLSFSLVDEEWKFQKKIMAFKYATQQLGEEINKLLIDDWGVKENFFLVGDDAKNISGMGGLFYASSAQLVERVTQSAFYEIKGVIAKIRDAAQYVNGSQTKQQEFQDCINTLNLQQQNKMELDLDGMPRSWASTFVLLENALALKNALSHLEQIDSEFTFNPSAEEWDRARVVHWWLKPFHRFISRTSPTLETFIGDVCVFYTRLIRGHDSQFLDMVTQMKKKFDECWIRYSFIFEMTAVLDPRYNLGFVEFVYRKMFGSEADMKLKEIRTNLTKMHVKYAEGSEREEPMPVQTPDDDDDDCDIFAEWRGQNLSRDDENELEKYLKMGLQKDVTDALAWWRENAVQYPTVAKMARDHLCLDPIPCNKPDTDMIRKNPCFQDFEPSDQIVEALICGQDWLE